MMQASSLAKLATGSKHMARGMFHALAQLGNARSTPVQDARDGAHRLAATLGLIARSHGLRVRVAGEIPRMPALLVCNHVSYLDPLAILPLCPAIPMAKIEVAAWPIVGLLARQLGVTFIDPSDALQRAAALRRIANLLNQGISVLNFAEGTTTDGRTVGPFWRGSFGIAQRSAMPVVPMAIRYDDPKMAWIGGAAFLPHYVATSQKQQIGISLVIGAPMYPRTGEPVEHFAARAQQCVASLLHRAIPSRNLEIVRSTSTATNTTYVAGRPGVLATRSESIFSRT